MGAWLRHLLKVILWGTGVVAVLSFVAAIVISRVYWGFFFHRPGMDSRISQVERVQSVTALQTQEQVDGTMRFVYHDGYDIADRLSVCRDDRPSISYYCLDERILAALDDLGELPAEPERMPETDLARLYHTLKTTQLLHLGAPGYDRAGELVGIAVVADARDGQRVLIVGVAGGEVSNDHHPYYEFLFRLPEEGTSPILLSSRRFYYDVAGYEGLHGPRIFLVILPPAMIALVVVVAGLSILSAVRQIRLSHVSGL
jgi:hypothetical protein